MDVDFSEDKTLGSIVGNKKIIGRVGFASRLRYEVEKLEGDSHR